MAEFSVVMKHIKRLCETHSMSCTGCLLAELGGRCLVSMNTESFDNVPSDWDLSNLPVIEQIVMNWAKENPEPRYPSWEEWWRREFPNADNAISPCTFGIRERFECFGQGCETCRAQPIPADIAEKLHIKPIGGEENG